MRLIEGQFLAPDGLPVLARRMDILYAVFGLAEAFGPRKGLSPLGSASKST
jgi:hypothetical protein